MKKKPKRRGKYGYVEFVDKRKLKYDGYDDNIDPEIRKPTPAEREEIILNFNIQSKKHRAVMCDVLSGEFTNSTKCKHRI